MYYNTNPIARYSGLQYAGSSLYNNRGRVGRRKGKRSILKGRGGILSSLGKTVGSKALSVIKSGAKQALKRGKSAASSQLANLKSKAISSGKSQLANLKSQAISSGKSLLDRGKSTAVSKIKSLKSTFENKLKNKLATAPAALASHATRKLEKLINKGSSSLSSALPASKRSQIGQRSSSRRAGRRRRRRRRRARAARLGLARAIGLNSSIGML